MATLPLIQIFYPRPSTDLRNHQQVKRWCDKIAAKEYYIYSDDEPLNWVDVKDYTISASISSNALQEISAFCQGSSNELVWRSVYLREYFTFTAGINTEENIVFVTLDSGDIYYLPNYRLLIEQIELVYQQWHPLYGFLWTMGGSNDPYTTREETLAGTVHGLYEINIFGPELVAKLGKERLLTAPAWYIKEFDDGGILLIPSPYTEDPVFHDTKARVHVAEHMGIPFL